MQGRHFISIVVPTRNRVGLLAHALGSFVDLDYPGDQYEIVVVDDGSTDGTTDVVARLATVSTQPPVRFFRSQGSGGNAARNLGAREAIGDVLCFVDDDTEASDGWLRAVIEATETYPDVGVFAGRIQLRLEGSPPRTCGREPLGETELDLGDDDAETAVAWGANLIIRREVLTRIGPFDETLPIYGDEFEWVYRYTTSGGRILYVANATIVHRRPAASLTPMALLRRSIQFGRGWAAASPLMSQPFSVAGTLAAAARGFAHGLTRGCFVGYRNAFSSLGTSTEAIRLLVRGDAGPSISWLPRHPLGMRTNRTWVRRLRTIGKGSGSR
jgi:GT2 family glycosyltransferase